MIFPQTGAGYGIRVTADSVGLLEKANIVDGSFLLSEELIHGEFPMLNACAVGEHIVHSRLGQSKANSGFCFCIKDLFFLLLFCGEYHLARSKPLIHEDHALNASGHRRPQQIFLSLPAKVRAAPQMEHRRDSPHADRFPESAQ